MSTSSTKKVLPITELDFFQAKNQLKEFLRNDPSGKFRDYDFEGSNMSVLLDVLAYNTYQNNFYTNMAITEMFLDSAQLENSVVSHAKELNYLPRSATSARAVVNVSIRDPQNTDSTIVIPENTRFTTTQGGERYNFYTAKQYTARRTGDDYVVSGVEIFEGEIINEAFFVSNKRKTIRLLNENVDTSSIRVYENYDEPLDLIEYIFKNDIFGVMPDDPVFYLEPSFDKTFEVVFGGNRFGRIPPTNSEIRVVYRITSGADANGASRFATTFKKNTSVTTISRATGGAEKETLEDIKFFAPRSIQVQERAVTTKDYEILLKQRFNEITDVSVIGGDLLEPPRYGKVAISVNLQGGLSESAKKTYEEFLKDKTPVGIQPIFLPPEFMYTTVVVDVYYDPRRTTKTASDIENLVRTILKTYSETSLGKFGSIMEISRISSLIDDSDSAISSNTITASPYILYSPKLNIKDNPVFNFGTQLRSPCRFATAAQTEVYNSLIRSGPFTYEKTLAAFEDNGLGDLHIIETEGRADAVFNFIKRNVGTVDYQTGVARLSDFIVENYVGNGIKVTAETQEKNVTSPKTKILTINDADVTVNVKEVLKNGR